jgi:hypothetical protein
MCLSMQSFNVEPHSSCGTSLAKSVTGFSFLRFRMQFVHSTPFLRSKIMRLSGSSSSRLGGGLGSANS